MSGRKGRESSLAGILPTASRGASPSPWRTHVLGLAKWFSFDHKSVGAVPTHDSDLSARARDGRLITPPAVTFPAAGSGRRRRRGPFRVLMSRSHSLAIHLSRSSRNWSGCLGAHKRRWLAGSITLRRARAPGAGGRPQCGRFIAPGRPPVRPSGAGLGAIKRLNGSPLPARLPFSLQRVCHLRAGQRGRRCRRCEECESVSYDRVMKADEIYWGGA